MKTALRLNRVWLTGLAALLLITVISVCGCSKPTPKIVDRRVINNLIDSLANRNNKPIKTDVSAGHADDAPLFDDNYDWNEDRRVREVAARLRDECDREELLRCLPDHFDDERYSAAVHFNGETRIEPVCAFCLSTVHEELEFPYLQLRADADTRYVMSLFSKDKLKGWCSAHKDIPIYKQQIELCEEAIKNTATVKLFSNEQKSRLTAEIEKEIELLQRTARPVFSEEPLYRMHFFNAKLAKEIKEKYLAKKQKDTPQVEGGSR
jgi:hypothetical protein